MEEDFHSQVQDNGYPELMVADSDVKLILSETDELQVAVGDNPGHALVYRDVPLQLVIQDVACYPQHYREP